MEWPAHLPLVGDGGVSSCARPEDHVATQKTVS